VPVRFVIVGGGPAGIQAASTAARLGAEVTLVERHVIGGAANLWDCIPSKAMISTGAIVSLAGRARAMGVDGLAPVIDLPALAERVHAVEQRLETSFTSQLESQGVRIVRGVARLTGPHTVAVDGDAPGSGDVADEEFEADAVLLATGSTPRVPDWAPVDGDRVLVTRQAYPPKVLPEHVVVIGSGVTGVEFVHLFRSLGSRVTLIVSRQQVLPTKDPEVASALETDFLASGVALCMGARATAIEVDSGRVTVRCDDGRAVVGSHVLLAIGSVPASAGLGLEAAGVTVNEQGYVPINHHCQSNVPHVYAAGDLSGRLQLASVAAVQGRKVAEHVMGLHTRVHRHLDYDKAASAIFTEPEIADVGLAEAEAFALGRKIRVTKVPFAANARAIIDGDARGFVKLVSDPATGIVLGGSIVGARAAELISVVALAVTAGLRVVDLAESLFVHPALAEALAEAAD
jgi:pyruvate/2-oxoglutarate dehydrogenase complex dihydrolipoamide dehydrogenase (E3) component